MLLVSPRSFHFGIALVGVAKLTAALALVAERLVGHVVVQPQRRQQTRAVRLALFVRSVDRSIGLRDDDDDEVSAINIRTNESGLAVSRTW